MLFQACCSRLVEPTVLMVMLLKAKETANCSQRLLKLFLASLIVFVLKPLQLNWNFWQRYVWRKKRQLKINSDGYLCSCMLSFLPVSSRTAKHCGAWRSSCTFYGPRRNWERTGAVWFWYSHLETLKKILVLLLNVLSKEVTVPRLKDEFPLGQH